MAFTAEISRTNPTCLLFLIDQSTSMSGPFGGQPGKKKCEGVADAINRLLQNLVLKCAKADGIRDYFHVGVIGYGKEVAPILMGSSHEQPLVPISAIAATPLRVEQRVRQIDDGAGGLIDQSFRFPIWFEPVANGKTPMNGAFLMAKEIITDFLLTYPNCFPPLILNLTDGQPTDANPIPTAGELKVLKSHDGNPLIFNAHLSSLPAAPVAFPSEEANLPDVFAKALFRMSSILPPKFMTSAMEEGYTLVGPSRGFMFNADLVSVIRFLEIGTRVAYGAR
jgi:hypothetical protein